MQSEVDADAFLGLRCADRTPTQCHCVKLKVAEAHAGSQWTYVPSVGPFREGHLDPAYVMQLQFQVHATGADRGFLVSWSRQGLSIFEVPYSHALVAAAAKVLQTVISLYLDPSDIPTLPTSFAALPDEAQTAVVALYKELGPVMGSCKRLELPGRWNGQRTCQRRCEAQVLRLFVCGPERFLHVGYQHRVPGFMHPMWLPRQVVCGDEDSGDGAATGQQREARRPGITAGVFSCARFRSALCD